MNFFHSPLLAVPVTAFVFLYASIAFGGATGYRADLGQFRIDP
jgi:hypothetical protein